MGVPLASLTPQQVTSYIAAAAQALNVSVDSLTPVLSSGPSASAPASDLQYYTQDPVTRRFPPGPFLSATDEVANRTLGGVECSGRDLVFG